MSLCNQCYAPGQCCKGFTLFSGGQERTFWLDGNGTVEEHLGANELPFVAHPTGEYAEAASGRRYGSFVFSCSQLTPEGRCAIYRRRPQICRDFEPAGGSPLCVHSGGAEGTGDGL